MAPACSARYVNCRRRSNQNFLTILKALLTQRVVLMSSEVVMYQKVRSELTYHYSLY